MSKEIRNMVKRILNEEFGDSQKKRLIEIINNLEFKNDVLAAGGEIYAVGGIVRDAIMGTPSDDLDIVVRGIPYDRLFNILSRYGKAKDTSHGKKELEFKALKPGEDVNQHLKGHQKDIDASSGDFGSTIFVSYNEEFNNYLAQNGVVRDIDVMLPRKDAKDPNVKGHKGIKSDVNPMYTIEDDLQRRDITINAIAMDINGNIFTSGTGLEDIQNGIIKAVNDDAFIEDPLRMLRAVRFAARYNYNWDPATVELIKNNAGLLADKEELPKERFLKEFTKMIGKSDLARAVKMLVDFGMYESIFGIRPNINDYERFDKAHNVGEFAYMMFENESPQAIVPLIKNNITNSGYDLAYAEALVKYNGEVKNQELTDIERVNKMAELYKLSKDAVLESTYINPVDREIANKFQSGRMPKNANELAFKGNDFMKFITDIITHEKGQFQKKDGVMFGNAKNLAIQAIYAGEIENDVESIKNFLLDHIKQWLL